MTRLVRKGKAMYTRRSVREWWRDSELSLACVAVVLAGVAFSLAPIWW